MLDPAYDKPHSAVDPQAVARLLQALDSRGYRFVTPGGAVIAANRRRRGVDAARDLRDIFGWSLPFDRANLPAPVFDLARAAGVLQAENDRWRSIVRVSTVEGRLFVHSAYPPRAADAVFLGPDTYRFARLVVREASKGARSVLDIGTGAGVGAVLAAVRQPLARVVASDINGAALALAAASAKANDAKVRFEHCDGLPVGDGLFDLIVANPPFISGRHGRTYRDGGAQRGLEIPLAWAQAGAQRLTPGGRLLIYTGSPIEHGGGDPFRLALERALPSLERRLDYEEVDPDIFGGLLGRADYEGVERIAAVAAVIRAPD